MFLQASVILLTGGSASVHARIPPHREQAPSPRSRLPSPEQPTPQEADPPGAGTPSRSRPPKEADPPGTEHAGRYGQRGGGTHPTGMQSCCQLSIPLCRTIKDKVTVVKVMREFIPKRVHQTHNTARGH